MDKVAIVTGGNSGIGKAVVLALAEAGANVVIDYVVNPDATEQLEKQIAALGGRAIGVDADVSKVEDLQMLVDKAVESFGRLDIMVNNAGIETRTSVLDTTEAQYDRVMAINLKSAFFGTQIAATTDPAALQAICDWLDPGEIRVFAERWWSRLPLPLTEHDRAAGYWWELPMRQVETSRTLVFDAPRRARSFFEALVADNLDIGRPELIELIFRRGQRRGRPAAGEYKTKIVTYGTEVNVNAFYRHSRIKQYLKDGRALRIETVINDPGDLGCLRRLAHLDELQTRARAVNTTLLDTERVGQGCVLASPAFERIARPTLTEDGRRAPALRFGDPRVQALAGALCTSLLAVTGITNKSLRALMTGPLDDIDYTMSRASYDLARLARNGLITRVPGRNLYRLTGDGLRFAIFYTKLHDRLLRPLLAADQPPASPPARDALRTIDIHISERIDQARLLPKAA